MSKYKFTVCGGTFDLFHKGHEELIKKALSISDKVLIGVTSNAYLNSHKNHHKIEDYSLRKTSVIKFLKEINAEQKAIVVPINSAYEPYLETSNQYDSIVVSLQTEKVANVINKKRTKNKLNKLSVIVAPNVLAEDKKIISSTRIRNGEINRLGKLYVNPIWKNKTLILPIKLRSALQIPWGRVYKNIPKSKNGKNIVVVGDFVSSQFNKIGVNQYLSIIDYLINRKITFKNTLEIGFSNEKILKVVNPAGTVTSSLFKVISKAYLDKNERKVILVKGEEDLAVIPAILISPLGFKIYYGQPSEGIVEVIVTEKIKDNIFRLVNKFKVV